MKTIFINLLAFGTLISSVTAITSKNPVISVIHLIATFVQAAGFLILIGINFVGISYIVVYVGAIAVLFLFVIMMINVRLCAYATRETSSFNSYSNRIITTESGQGESPRLNIASQFNGSISPRGQVDFQVILSMVKATLLEVYTLGAPHHGLYLGWDRIHVVLVGICLLLSNRVTITRVIIYCNNLWKGLPKESAIEVCIGTEGSPKEAKEENFHGDRVLIVPQSNFTTLSGRSTRPRVFNRNIVGFGEAKRHYAKMVQITHEPRRNELTILNKLKNLHL